MEGKQGLTFEEVRQQVIDNLQNMSKEELIEDIKKRMNINNILLEQNNKMQMHIMNNDRIKQLVTLLSLSDKIKFSDDFIKSSTKEIERYYYPEEQLPEKE